MDDDGQHTSRDNSDSENEGDTSSASGDEYDPDCDDPNISFSEAFSQAKDNLSIINTVVGTSFGSSSSVGASHRNEGDDKLAAREYAKLCRKAMETMALSRKFSELRPAELLKAITAIAESVAAAKYADTMRFRHRKIRN